MPEVFLHIGMHKTGTSSIQSACWNNRSLLQKSGILYPEIALSGVTHAKLANVFAHTDRWNKAFAAMSPKDPGAVGLYTVSETVEELYGCVRELYHSTEADTIVLSTECFLEWIDPENVAAQFIPYGIHPKIIVYIRRQDQWIQSVYNQLVKDRYIRYSGDFESLPQHEVLDHYTFLLPWAAAFGEQNIVLREYDRRNLVDGNVVADFFCTIRAEMVLKNPNFSFGTEENTSLHKEIVSILRSVNEIDAPYEFHVAALERLRALNSYLIGRDRASSFAVIDSQRLSMIYDKYKASTDKLRHLIYN